MELIAKRLNKGMDKDAIVLMSSKGIMVAILGPEFFFSYEWSPEVIKCLSDGEEVELSLTEQKE